MKKANVLFLPLVLLGFLSCDKVTDPIVKNDTVVGTQFVKNNNFAVSNIKKTLLEDYTGQTCPNCPDAAQTATALAEQYGNKLVVMAVHAGDFAQPIGTYTNNFTTTAGDTWQIFFNIKAFPSGMVNRKIYPGNSSYLILRTKWATAVAQSTVEPFIVKLDVETSYDTIVRSLSAEVKATFKMSFPTNIELIYLLIEDSIIGQQDVHGQDVEDYEFEHVMRGTLPDPQVWGKRLKTGPILAQTDTTSTLINFPVDSKYNHKKVSLVVIAFDSAKKEVLQVEKVKINTAPSSQGNRHF